MCTFENDHRVLVCDLAIHRVREAASRAFGDAVQFTPVPGEGTLVEVPGCMNDSAGSGILSPDTVDKVERRRGR